MLRKLLATDGWMRLWSIFDGDLATGDDDEEDEGMLYL